MQSVVTKHDTLVYSIKIYMHHTETSIERWDVSYKKNVTSRAVIMLTLKLDPREATLRSIRLVDVFTEFRYLFTSFWCVQCPLPPQKKKCHKKQNFRGHSRSCSSTCCDGRT